MKHFYALVLLSLVSCLAFSQTYHPLSSQPLIQNWTDTTLITVNDNWSGIASIRGFLGQDITTATGANPEELRGVSSSANDLDVIANQRVPSITNGGVAEFQGILNPTIALQGSGTADAPHLIIYLNTTGINNVRVQYNLRDIDSTADNAIQPVALQYRIGNTGDFINLPAGFKPDVTTGPSQNSLVTPVDVTLPAAANNQSQVELRIITTNAQNNDEWVGIDDINISASKAISLAAGADASEPATNGNFTVSFSPVTTAFTTFDYAFTDVATGTATFNADYTVSVTINGNTTALSTNTGTISAPAGATAATFSVLSIDDGLAEGTEHIQLNISNPSEGYSIGNAMASIDLLDNDASSTVAVTAGAAASEPAVTGNFTITLSSPAPAGGVTITYSLTGQAAQNTDYTDPSSGTITIAPGNTTADILINPVEDALIEGTETIIINLNSSSAGYVISGASATLNLLDNDNPPIVINEIYGGGGNSGATYRNDYIELYNNSSVDFSLDGWSVQYASSTGGNWQKTDLSGIIPAFGYYLIQEAAGTGGTASLPTPDATGNIPMAAAAGKVALVNNTVQLSGVCPTSSNIVDLLGFGTANCFEGTGAAIAPSNTTAIQRSTPGLDSDNNQADFVSTMPNPKNSVKDLTPPGIASSFPANSASNVVTAFVAALNFDEAIQKGTGNIFIKTADGTIVQTIDVNSSELTLAGSSASFIAQSLAFNTGYYFDITPGTFVDMEGNAFAGTTVNFATGNKPLGSLGTTYDFTTCTGTLPDGFTFYSVTGPQVWGCTTFGRNASDMPLGSAPNGVQINGFSGTNIQNEDWLISPAYDLTSTTFPLWSFYSRTRFNGLPLQLKVSTDYPGTGDPRSYTWTDINGKFPAQTSDAWTLSSNINLAAFKGSNVHLAFVYYSSEDDGARWTLDDITMVNSSTPPPPALTVSATDIQFTYVAAGSSMDKTFTFTANDLTEAVTLSAHGDFLLSKDGTTFQSEILYTTPEANNIPRTVYLRFSPSQKNENFFGIVLLTTSDIQDTIFLKGTSIDPATTLEVVNWNVEWFGSTGFGPVNNDLQQQNVKTILQNIGADIYGLVEVVDESRLATVVSQMDGYSYVIGNFGSHVNPPEPSGGSPADAQKLAFVYKTSVFSNVTARPFINNQNTSSASYNNWASGRYPFLMSADVTLNCITKRISFILIHAKANTSPTVTSYARRQAAAVELHDSLETYFSDANVILLGDFNDDLDQTITDGINPPVSSYKIFTDDNVDFFSPTLSLSEAGKKSTVSYNDVIDHVMLTNDIQPYYMPGSANILTDAANLVNNYGSTTTDHYPVFTRYQFEQPAPPVVTTCPVVVPVCATATGTYTVPAFTATGSCGVIRCSYTVSGATERSGETNNASGLFNAGTNIITWTATDGAGQTITCQTTVIINVNPVVTIPDAYALQSGVIPNTVYRGYAPAESITLQSQVDGGKSPYNYSWTPAVGSTSPVTVSPLSPTTYRLIVEDANGCVDTAYKTIGVLDIRAGKKLDKVMICHNGKMLEIAPSAVSEHLSHGDKLGSCEGGNEPGENEDLSFKVKVLSNPTTDYFTIITESKSHLPLLLTVVDVTGRVTEIKTATANGTINLGSRYRKGIYYLFILQGKHYKIMKLVKQ